MSSEEKAILEYLKATPTEFFSAKEIGRRVGGKKKFAQDPYWARTPLRRLVAKELVETDSMNRYRFKPEEESPKKRIAVSPHIAQILIKSGKTFSSLALDEDEKPPDGGV